MDSIDADGNKSAYGYDQPGNVTSTTAPAADGATGVTTSAYTSALQDDSCDGTAEAASTASCATSSDEGPGPVLPGGVIAPPASAPAAGLTWTLNDNDGNQLYSTTGVYSPSGTYECSQTTYQLFKGNTITLNGTDISCTYTPPTAELPCATINADGVVTQLRYDGQGDLILSSTPDGNSGGQVAETTYTYNADGEQLTKVAPTAT